MKSVCVITGGANGIGRCLAQAFWSRGDQVVVIDRDEAAGSALGARLNDHFFFFHGDIAQKHVLDDFARCVRARFGRVNVLIHNACFGAGGLLSCDYARFEQVLRTGVTAPFYLTQQLLPALAPGALVLNIASTRAFQSQADTESYSAAKGGISALTHAMSVTLAGRARVNAISPGWIDVRAWQHAKTDNAPLEGADLLQHPAGRVGKPEDIAQLALFLADPDKAGFITGQNFPVDGGMTRRMIYHNDEGWQYQPETNPDAASFEQQR